MRPSGALDLAATQASIDRLIANGVSGVIVLPMLGENASLTQAERDAVVTAAREAVAGRVPCSPASPSSPPPTPAARRATTRRLGAEGLMAFPSLAYRTDRAETVAWYKAVAAEGLPVMIYNNPLAYRVDVDIPTLEGLAGIPEIVAIKEETGDIRRVTDLFNAFGDRFAVFCGVDDLILESLALGAIGWVSGMTNAWPAECVRLFDLARSGRTRRGARPLPADDPGLPPRYRGQARPAHQARRAPRLWRPRRRPPAAPAAPRRREGAGRGDHPQDHRRPRRPEVRAEVLEAGLPSSESSRDVRPEGSAHRGCRGRSAPITSPDMRHSAYLLRWRTDKAPESCTLDQIR